MELSSEDSFRLNVLLANRPLAIRIDETRMLVCGLSEKGEAKVPLNPVGRPEQYLRQVRELISGHILGSPGGYPVYLRRWTRMGQMRDQSLEQLLMLGEPEAVVAAVCSPGLTDELARRAWWAMEDAENARRMLSNPAVVAGEMGPVLARYLVDYLPFETDTETMAESVRLVLQPGLISAPERLDLWKKAARKQAYLLGFLQATPHDLPEPEPPRADAQEDAAALAGLAAEGDVCAQLLLRVQSSAGQTFLEAAAAVLGKPPTQDVVNAALDLLRDHFSALRPEGDPDLTIGALLEEAAQFAGPTPSAEVAACLAAVPGRAADIAAMRVLSGVGYGVLRPVLGDSTAIGGLMRRKLAPALDPILGQIGTLRGGAGAAVTRTGRSAKIKRNQKS
jgi:hypothetical protein